MLRLLHTSDWHLGHTLHGVPRAWEHDRFLEWLTGVLSAEAPDVLLITGDVFDTANPSASAQAAWYGFLARAKLVRPALEILVIAGNHDSPARLEAPAPLLREQGIVVIGQLGDPDALLVPLGRDASGEPRAWCAAVPFVRPSDLPPPADGVDLSFSDGVRALYARVLGNARARRRPGQALIATGHCTVVGGQESTESERRILGGQAALGADLFDPDLAYVALGHLHLAQAVPGSTQIRYAGSPIPLSLAEAGYPHQACLVDLEGDRLVGLEALCVPRSVAIQRIPATGALEPAELLACLDALPLLEGDPEAPDRPYLHLAVRVSRPDPQLRRQIDERLEGRHARFMALSREAPEASEALADARPGQDLEALSPEEVFRLRYRKEYPDDPPSELCAAFRVLLEDVRA